MLLGMYISMIRTVHSGAKDELGKRRKKQEKKKRQQRATESKQGKQRREEHGWVMLPHRC